MSSDRGSLSWDELDLARMRDELADVEWAIREAHRFGRSPELHLLDRRTILAAEIARREQRSDLER